MSQLENLGNFIKAILAYGLKPNDIFEANDLFENGNMTQVQTTLLALASMVRLTSGENSLLLFNISVLSDFNNVLDLLIKNNFCLSFLLQAKTKGIETHADIGVKYADKQQRRFDVEKLKAGQCVIGLQVINKFLRSFLMFVCP